MDKPGSLRFNLNDSEKAVFQVLQLLEWGDLVSSDRVLQLLVEKFAEDVQVLALASVVAFKQGDVEVARQFFDKARSVGSFDLDGCDDFQVLFLWGLALFGVGEFDEAFGFLKKAAGLSVQFPSVFVLLVEAGDPYSVIGFCLQRLGGLSDEVKARICFDMGCCLGRRAVFEVAEFCYRRAVFFNSGLVPAYCNLAQLLFDLEDYEGALRVCERGLAVDSEDVKLLFNFGLACVFLRRFQEADGCFRSIIRMGQDEDSVQKAHDNLATLLLRLGRFKAGWLEYGFHRPEELVQSEALYGCPFWKDEFLEGRSLLVWGEQGVGDLVMFAQCLPDVLSYFVV